MSLDNFTRDEMIVGGLAIALAICLLLFPWFSIGGGSVGSISIPSFDLTATDAPDGWLGILALLAALAAVADLVIEKLSPQTQLPSIGASRANTRFILVAVAAGFVALKFLFHIHFSDFGWGFYVTVIVAAALVYFAMQLRMGVPLTIPRPGRSGPPPPPVGTAGPSGTADPGAGGSTPPPGS